MAKKLTIDALIERKSKASADTKSVFVPGLDGELVIQKIPLQRMLNNLDGMNANSLKDSVDAQINLIYACVPMFRDKSLQEAYECREPSEIVCKVLNDNLGDIALLSGEIMAFYGLDDATDDLKN